MSDTGPDYTGALDALFAAGGEHTLQALGLIEALDEAALERDLLRYCRLDETGRLVRSARWSARDRPDLTEALLVLLSRTPSARSLTALNLDNEEMVRLPPEIGRFTALTSLSLRDTGIRELPGALWGLDLTALDLAGVLVTELPDLRRVSRLRALDLGKGDHWRRHAELGAPPLLGGLPLERLGLRSVGAMPDLTDLPALRELDLSDNALRELPPLGPSPLVRIDLQRNHLPDFPEALTRIDTLEAIDLSENSLRTLPEDIRRLWKLKRLSLAKTPIKRLPDELRFLRRLEVLDLSGANRLPDEQVAWAQAALPRCMVVR